MRPAALLLLCSLLPALAAGAGDDPMAAVADAFAAGKALPPLDPKSPGAEVYKRVKEVSLGCAAPCDTAAQVEKYKKAVALSCKLLGLEDAAAVQAVYCRAEEPQEGRSPCRLRAAVAAVPPKAGAPAKKDAPAAKPRGLGDDAQKAVIGKFEREAQGLADGKEDRVSAAGGGEASPAPRTPQARAKLPDIRALLDKAEPFAALLQKPPLSVTADEWDALAAALPDLQAASAELDSLFTSAAEPEAKKAAAAKDPALKAFLAEFQELKTRKEALAKTLAAVKPQRFSAQSVAKTKEASRAVSKALAAYARSGRLEDLQAAAGNLDAFFENIGVTGDAKAAAIKEFQRQAAAGKIGVADGQDGPSLVFGQAAASPGPSGAGVSAGGDGGEVPAAGDTARREEGGRLELAGLAAAAQLPLPKGAHEKAQRAFYEAYGKAVHRDSVDATGAFIQAWSSKDAKLQALDERLEKARGKPAAERQVLREADEEIDRFLRKHPEARTETDAALAGTRDAYARARLAKAAFSDAWLRSGVAPKGTAFYESELAPGRDTELAALVVDEYGGKRGIRQKREDGATLFVSDDGSLQESTGKTGDAYHKYLRAMGVSWNDMAGSFDERVEMSRGKPSRRLITLRDSSGKLGLTVEDTFTADGKLAQRTWTDPDEKLTKITRGDGTMTLLSDKPGNAWKRQDGAFDKKSGDFKPTTVINAAGLTLTVVSSKAGDTLVYEPVKGMRGAVDSDLTVSGFDIDISVLGGNLRGAQRQKAAQQTIELAARVYGWSDARAKALTSFVSYRLDNFCSASCSPAHLTVLRTGEANLTSDDGYSFQGQFTNSVTRGKSEEAFVYRYFVQDEPGAGKPWHYGKGSLQNEDFGDGQHWEVADMIGKIDADSDGTLNEEKGAVALLVYEFKDGKWTVVRGEKKAEYQIYKAQSRWSKAAEKLGNLPVLKQTLDIGKSAVNGVEGGILWAGAGITEIWDHDRSLQLRAHAWSSWGDVGISGIIEPSKDAARDLAEEDMKRSLGDDGYAEMLIEKHKKSIGWTGDDSVYQRKFGDSAAHNQDIRNAALDGMSAEHAGDYYMDKCHTGSNAWCVAGVATNVGKSFLEMPVMIGGLAGLELKTASWAARGARLLGAGADTAAAIYDTTRFGFTAVNTAQMAVPIAADAVQAVEACRKGDTAGCKDHISGLAAAAGSMGAFKFVYGKGLGELNAKWGAGDAKWLADAALTDAKAGTLALDEGGAKVLERISAGVKVESIEGIPAKYRENPAGLVADVALGKIAFVENGAGFTAVKPAKAAKPSGAPKPDAAPQPDALPGRDAVVKRFGGVDPQKLAEEKGIRIGGQGGGGAKLIEINGEQWVVKTRNIPTDPRARSAARHELLGRQLVSAFFGEFDTTEAMAYEHDGKAVTVNKYDPSAKADDARFLGMNEQQRVQLSVLTQVFGLGDVNHGNILFGEGRKPVIIDMESIISEPLDAGQYGPDAVKMTVDWGHAAFVDRNAYNDPAPYHAEIGKWRARFEDPAFEGQLDAALQKAGFSEPDAAAYKDAVKKNLANYEKNMDQYLGYVNSKHPKPPEPAVTRALHDPVGFAKDLFGGATNPGKRGARAPKADEGPAAGAPPVHAETPLEQDYHDFALDPYAGGARGRDFVVVEDLEPGATLEVRRSRAHPEDTAEAVRELEGMGFKTRLSDEFVEDQVAKNKRTAAYDRARRLDLPDGLKGDAFLAGGHFSVGDGGVVKVRASRSHPEASQAVADALKAGGFKPEISETEFVEDYLAEQQKEAPAGDEQAAEEQPAAELPQARNLPPQGPGTAVIKKKPAAAKEAATAGVAPDGDGGHGENGSVEEASRAKQLDLFVVDPAGRVSRRPDGVVDLPSKGRYSLVQRSKKTGRLELVQGDQKALDKVEAFLARTEGRKGGPVVK